MKKYVPYIIIGVIVIGIAAYFFFFRKKKDDITTKNPSALTDAGEPTVIPINPADKVSGGGNSRPRNESGRFISQTHAAKGV